MRNMQLKTVRYHGAIERVQGSVELRNGTKDSRWEEDGTHVNRMNTNHNKEIDERRIIISMSM